MGTFVRLAFSGAVLVGLASAAHAETLNTDGFLAACVADDTLDQIEGVGTTITPKDFCACVAGKILESELTQDQVDIVTKIHKYDVEDTASDDYDTAQQANMGFEEACSKPAE
jgi:hypothetical protein